MKKKKKSVKVCFRKQETWNETAMLSRTSDTATLSWRSHLALSEFKCHITKLSSTSSWKTSSDQP